jgi:hypothetical protein
MTIASGDPGDNPEDLRRAVATEHSWRGVARALGLSCTSAGTIRALKRRAAKLGLDTSHFTFQRTWTDQALTDAVARASSWTEALSRSGLTGGDARGRLRGHAIRLGLDITHLEAPRTAPRPMKLPVHPAVRFLRDAAESFAAAWFLARGLQVDIPARPTSYDLLVDLGERGQRVQVKSTTFRGRQGSWTVNIGRRPYVLDKSGVERAVRP